MLILLTALLWAVGIILNAAIISLVGMAFAGLLYFCSHFAYFVTQAIKREQHD